MQGPALQADRALPQPPEQERAEPLHTPAGCAGWRGTLQSLYEYWTLLPNHPALSDALLLARHPNLACVMKSELMANVLLGPGARLARYIRNGPSRVNSLTRSVAAISRRARVPVQALLIETDSPFPSKGWPLWKRPSLPIVYRVCLGRRFEPPEDIPALERHYCSELQGGLTHGWLGRSIRR